MTTADRTAKWLDTCRARAALHAVELHILDDGEFILTRGHHTQRVHSRSSLVAILRVLGVEVEDPPREVEP